MLVLLGTEAMLLSTRAFSVNSALIGGVGLQFNNISYLLTKIGLLLFYVYLPVLWIVVLVWPVRDERSINEWHWDARKWCHLMVYINIRSIDRWLQFKIVVI